ncbi:uncharacterized protein MAL13P1.304-like isoform X2 [Sipha flava]|nr:uncharacterized protein MAL13P1.304-like isoform X2 [Sipha flava]XP_025410198.1 uncharacterized protein MAL13P1.304-like isoform X2 [Sipha flava]XP_025410199.1 uncharacterized protein MAL13P1.304-like isoform X2 [Sipha flava]
MASAVQSNANLEKLHREILKKINKEQFESEYETFMDGIVSATFEFYCKFVIVNCTENIERTQSALYSPNLNNGGINKECYNKSTKELEFLKQPQIHLPFEESNNNTTDFIELETSGLNIENNFIDTTHMSLDVNGDNDLQTDDSLMSLDLKIEQKELQLNSNFENFENLSNESIGNGIQINSSMIQNVANNDSIEEDPKKSPGLKILKNLVEIENCKLEVEKCPDIREEFPQLNYSSILNKYGRKYGKRTLKKKEHQILNIGETSSSMKRKMEQPENHDKPNKIKRQRYKTSKKGKKVSKLSIDMNNLTLSTSSSNKLVQSDKNNIIYENGTNILMGVQISETSVNSLFVSQTNKDNVLNKELQIQQDSTENSTFNEEYLVSANNSNTLQMRIYPTNSTNNNDKSMGNSKIKSFNHSGLTMKTSDYKKLYEKDRKSLFNPDIIIRSNLSKNSVVNRCMKNENNKIEKKDDCVVNKKSKIQGFKIQLKNLSAKKNLSKKRNGLKKSSCSTIVEKKRFKIKKETIDKIVTNTKINIDTNKTKASITAKSLDISRCNNLPNTNTLENNSLPDWLKAKCILYNIKPVYIHVEPIVPKI